MESVPNSWAEDPIFRLTNFLLYDTIQLDVSHPATGIRGSVTCTAVVVDARLRAVVQTRIGTGRPDAKASFPDVGEP